MFKRFKKLWLALGALVVLTPLGLLASGTAFGEWSIEELPQKAGFIPAGLAKFADIWTKSPLADYKVPGVKGGFVHSAGGYILSALIGVVLVVTIISILSKIVKE